MINVIDRSSSYGPHIDLIFDQYMRNSSADSSDSRIWPRSSECSACVTAGYKFH